MKASPPLSLDQLTLLDVQPEDLVGLAADNHCAHISVFINVPEESRSMFPLVRDRRHVREIKARLDDSGVSVWNLEAFTIMPDFDPSTYREALELGAELGGKGATALIADPDPLAAAESLAAFGELAREYDVRVGLEWFRYSSVTTFRAALDTINRSGSDNVKLVIDPLHLFRNGGTTDDIAALDPAKIGYVQIADGPRIIAEDQMWDEMIGGRLLPGDGDFPLIDFLTKLPAIPVLGIEIPRASVGGIVPPSRMAAEVAAATRSVLAQAGMG